MKEVEFCYWLQGYFELADLNGHSFVNGKMLQCIQKHLDMVKRYQGNTSSFTSWVQGFVDAISIEDDERLSFGLTEKLKGELENMFLHEIDNSYDDKEHKMITSLNQIHGNQKFRC